MKYKKGVSHGNLNLLKTKFKRNILVHIAVLYQFRLTKFFRVDFSINPLLSSLWIGTKIRKVSNQTINTQTELIKV